MDAQPSGSGHGRLLEVQDPARPLAAIAKEAVLAWHYVGTITGGGLERDEDGVELVDDASARRMAWTCLGEELAVMTDPPTLPSLPS